MSKELKVGIIGTSRAKLFKDQIDSTDRAAVTAICGSSEQSSAIAANELKVENSWSDYRSMYEDAHIDAVIITTPDHLHHEMALDALDAGLHVLCEKPLALNTEQAEEMTAKAERLGLKNMVNFSWRNKPEFLLVYKLLSEQVIGRWYDFQLSWMCGKRLGSVSSPFHDYYSKALRGWRMDGTRSNGVLSDFGSHLFDVIHNQLSPIVEIAGSVKRGMIENSAELNSDVSCPPESVSAVVKLQNGSHGIVNISEIANVKPHLSLSIYGESGHLSVRSGLKDYSVVMSRGDHEDENELDVPDDLKYPVGITALFLDSILNDRIAEPTFTQGLKVQKILDAVLNSSKNGCWKSIE